MSVYLMRNLDYDVFCIRTSFVLTAVAVGPVSTEASPVDVVRVHSGARFVYNIYMVQKSLIRTVRLWMMLF